MKLAIAATFAFAMVSMPVFATDYNRGQCPKLPVCYFTSAPVPSEFSDTMSFYLGDWPGYAYASTSDVRVSGGSNCAIGRICYKVTITSATIDGMPLIAPMSGYTWTLGIDLTPGLHVIAVTGTATGNLSQARWSDAIDGVTYTPVMPPPCTGHDCGGN